MPRWSAGHKLPLLLSCAQFIYNQTSFLVQRESIWANDYCECMTAATDFIVAFTTTVATLGTSLATLWMGGTLGPSKVSRIPSGGKKENKFFVLFKNSLILKQQNSKIQNIYTVYEITHMKWVSTSVEFCSQWLANRVAKQINWPGIGQ